MKDLNAVFCRLHKHSQPRKPYFKLCPECRQDAPHEAKVVETVVNYFLPILQGFFIETEYEIQMGAHKRRADVVFGVDTPGFIVECKREGFENIEDGINQLKSYLCATDTSLGIYADSTNPDDWVFYENLGKNQFSEIAWDQFWIYLQNISGENIAEALFEVGQNYSRMAGYEDAITHYTHAISVNVKYTSAYICRAEARRKLSQHEDAIDDYNKAIELKPDLMTTYFQRGRTKLHLREYEASIADFEKVIEDRTYPFIYSVYYYLGIAKYNMRQYDAAIANYNKALELILESCNPCFIYKWRGIAKGELGQHESAIADFDMAIELNSDKGEIYASSANPYCHRGIAKDKLGQYEAAIDDFDKSIKIYPNYAFAYFNRGKAKFVLGKRGDAITDFDKVIELNLKSRLPDAYYYRGRAKIHCCRIYNFHDGIADFDKAIELDPDHTSAYIYRAITQIAMEKYDGAANDLDKTIEIEPDNEIAPILHELCKLLLPF